MSPERCSKKKEYNRALHKLQVELVKLQRHIIKNNLQILIIFEGRDAAGKDGVIKRIIQHLSPRETRVVALGKPDTHDVRSWYFERYVAQLPSVQEMVLMNRSWYNRAGVERVMGFCTDHEYDTFMKSVLSFEHLLIDSGIQIIKYYLDISKSEQEKRLKARLTDPLKLWKTSPIDEVAIKHWDEYSKARDEMLQRTHSVEAPWSIVKADNKKATRLNVIRHLLSRVNYQGKDEHAAIPDQHVVFNYNKKHLVDGSIAA